MKQHAQAPPLGVDFLSHAAPVGLGLLNSELRFVRLNNQLAGLSAKPISEHIGRTFWEIAPGIAGQLEPLCRRVMASGEPVLNREIHGTTPATAGAKRHWLASCYPNKSDQGGLDGVSLVVQEANAVGPAPERRAPGDANRRWRAGIAERRASGAFLRRPGPGLAPADPAQGLRDSQERYALATRAGQVGIWDWNLETNEVYVDPAVKRMLGFEDHEIQDQVDSWAQQVHPADREPMAAAARECLEGRAPQFEMEHRMLCKDGGVRWFLARGSAIRDNNGKTLRLTGTDTDITERRDAEQERHRLKQRVLEAELEQHVQRAQKLESLSVLAGGMAHDFNNLLVGILGNASLALMALPPQSPVRPLVEQIEKAGHLAADLTKQMLAYSGNGRFDVRPLHLSRLVAEMARLLESVVSREVALEYDLAAALPAIEADATQLRQVVLNLIANGSDAIGNRKGSVKVKTGEQEVVPGSLRGGAPDTGFAGGRSVFLEVSDSGCGMDASTQSRIFDPFFSTKVTGRGLGLAAVLGIVRGHRGAIRVQSQPGRGTTFRVLFPVSNEERSQAPHFSPT